MKGAATPQMAKIQARRKAAQRANTRVLTWTVKPKTLSVLFMLKYDVVGCCMLVLNRIL